MNTVPAGGFRAQYNTYGVSNYYAQIASTYRNPHFTGVQKCIHQCLDRILSSTDMGESRPSSPGLLSILDLAAGSGEATISTASYFQRSKLNQSRSLPNGSSCPPSTSPNSANSSSLEESIKPHTKPLSRTQFLACDPFTSELYTQKTGLYCSKRGFKELMTEGLEGLISEFHDYYSKLKQQKQEQQSIFPDEVRLRKRVDIVICSFALHLVPEGGELWGLLYELSRGAKWLVVIAPHKKPEIDKDGRMGWVMEGEEMIVKEERVRGRIFKSLNYGEEDG